MRLTWKKEPSETGLRRVCQGPRGKILSADGCRLADVNPHPTGFHQYRGWYWTAGTSTSEARSKFPALVSMNSLWDEAPGGPKVYDTIEEAMAAAEAYVRTALGLPQKKEK